MDFKIGQVIRREQRHGYNIGVIEDIIESTISYIPIYTTDKLGIHGNYSFYSDSNSELRTTIIANKLTIALKVLYGQV